MDCCFREETVIERAAFCCGCHLFWGQIAVAVIYTIIAVHGVLQANPI